MPGIARVSTDTAQGIITGPGSSTVKADGKRVSFENDKVAGHGDAPHTAPTLTSTANLGDVFVFRYNGTKWIEVGRNLALTLS